MSTIPLIFNERLINHVILGGSEQPKKVLIPVTCIVINRSGGQYKNIAVENLINLGFEQIISVETKSKSFNTEQISRMFPTVKFIIAIEDNLTQGDLLNLGMSEVKTEYVLVLQDDMCTEPVNFSCSLAKKMISMNQFCVVPRLSTSNLSNIPVHFIPDVNKGRFCVESSMSVREEEITLYAYDYAGFYNKNKYIFLGGCDYTITNSYWQKLDLFLRSWLWGERTSIGLTFQLSYGIDLPVEEQTVDLSYLRFYQKNLLPVYISDHAHIPMSLFLTYRSRSRCGISEDIRQFNEARQWVDSNKYRFKTDAVNLIKSWGK